MANPPARSVPPPHEPGYADTIREAHRLERIVSVRIALGSAIISRLHERPHRKDRRPPRNVRRRLHAERPHDSRAHPLPAARVRRRGRRASRRAAHPRGRAPHRAPDEPLARGDLDQRPGKGWRRLLPHLAEPRSRVRRRARRRSLPRTEYLGRLLSDRLRGGGDRDLARGVERLGQDRRGRRDAHSLRLRVARRGVGHSASVRGHGGARARVRIVLRGCDRCVLGGDARGELVRGSARLARLLAPLRHLLPGSDRLHAGREPVGRPQEPGKEPAQRHVRGGRRVDGRLLRRRDRLRRRDAGRGARRRFQRDAACLVGPAAHRRRHRRGDRVVRDGLVHRRAAHPPGAGEGPRVPDPHTVRSGARAGRRIRAAPCS